MGGPEEQQLPKLLASPGLPAQVLEVLDDERPPIGDESGAEGGVFREEVNRSGGGNYQTLVNDALRQHVEATRENLEETLRRVLREELGRLRGPRG